MEFKDRVKELRRMPASELLVNERNFRQHSEEQLTALTTVLEKVGFAGAELAYETEQGVKLIDGHARKRLVGDQDVPVLILDVNEEEAAIILASFDQIGSMATVDEAMLNELIGSIETQDQEVADLLSGLVADAELATAGMDDKVAPEAFPEVGEDIETEHECPKCHYRYSGGKK